MLYRRFGHGVGKCWLGAQNVPKNMHWRTEMWCVGRGVGKWRPNAQNVPKRNIKFEIKVPNNNKNHVDFCHKKTYHKET